MNNIAQNNRGRPDNEIRILDLIEIFVRQWRAVAALVFTSLVVAACVLLVLPERYVSTVVVVPSVAQSSVSSQLASQLPAGLIGQLAGAAPGERLIGAIVKSRSLADSIAQRLGRGTNGIAEVKAVATEHSKVKSNDDGSITITVRARDPKRAADIANAYPAVINSIASQLSAEAALRKQEFLARQITEARQRLERSERRLIAFQRKEDIPEVQQQATRTLDAAAALQQRIIDKQLEIAELRRASTADNPQLRAATADVRALRDQLDRLTAGTSGGQVLLSLDASPSLKATSARLTRDYTQDEQVYSSLMSALVQAQIDSQSDLPVLSVLDPGIVPLHPDTSQRPVVLVLALVVGLALGVLVAFCREYLARARRDPENENFFAAVAEFRRDVHQLIPLSPRRRIGDRESAPR